MGNNGQPWRILSADIQDGIDYEVRREIVNMKIAEKISEMFKDGVRDPTEEEIIELRQLAASRNQVGIQVKNQALVL